MSGSALPQAGGVNEGQGARRARNPHALTPRQGQAVRLHAIAEQDEGFGGNDEAEVFVLIQDALGVFDAGEGRGPRLAHKPRERARGRRG